MRKKNVLSKDKKKRQLIQKFELKKLFYDFIIYQHGFKKYKLHALYYRGTLPKNSSYIRAKNYCILTGRNKGVYRMFKVSRIKIRELLSVGLLPNYIKQS